jgi:hypothetical protein
MNTKTDKPKTKGKDEERFYQFAKALIAVPKKELDKQLAKHEREKETKPKKSNGRA